MGRLKLKEMKIRGECNQSYTVRVSHVLVFSLSNFLTSRLAPNISANINTTPISDDDAARGTRSSPPTISIVSLSMLGQPPSESDVSSRSFNESESAEDSLNKEIRGVLRGQLNSNVPCAFQNTIMQERLDEKECMFMDGMRILLLQCWLDNDPASHLVPILSQPNEHFRNATRGMEEGKRLTLCLALYNLARKLGMVPLNISKKVTGLKSLNIELSWRYVLLFWFI